MALAGFPLSGGRHARKTSEEPGMLMKIKQVNEELQRYCSSFRKSKYLKLNRLSTSVVGYHGAEK
jgi:hypothetical protein